MLACTSHDTSIPYQYLCFVYSPGGSRYKGVQNIQTSLQRSGSACYRRRVVSLSCTFQRAVLAALCGTDGGSWHFRCTVLAALWAAGVCLCLFLLLNVIYLPIYAKLRLVVGMAKQMLNDKEADIVKNHVERTKWDRHDDRGLTKPSIIMSTSLPSFDMIFLGLAIHYVYLLTISHLYNVI